MQAYASAQRTPLVSEFEFVPVRSVAHAVREPADARPPARFDDTQSPFSNLASLILDELDDHGLAVLARRLLPHLRQPAEPEQRGRVAYTVASLSVELGVSQKAIRCAISRRELPAVKRGSRWIISADDVRAWATASDQRRRTGRASVAAAPKAAGPSLRAVLSGADGVAGTR
jgi:excisionase family DNA binding protein